MNQRRAAVGVMGAGEGASAETVTLAEALGECIRARRWVLLTGGRPAGVMAAASRDAVRVERHLVVGVLPDERNGDERPRTTAGSGGVHRYGQGPQREQRAQCSCDGGLRGDVESMEVQVGGLVEAIAQAQAHRIAGVHLQQRAG